jgi:hypothetical protein
MGLAGTWYNELGSKMEITVNGLLLTGTYKSGVGAEGTYSLTGAFDTNPVVNKNQSLGFVVAWQNEKSNHNSTTSWSGRYLETPTSETLVTFWLLTAAQPAQWESTLIGEDIFTRTAPSEETKQRRLARGTFPHPMS